MFRSMPMYQDVMIGTKGNVQRDLYRRTMPIILELIKSFRSQMQN